MAHVTCLIDWCNEPRHGRLYCNRHYRKWKRYGDPLFEVLPRGDDPTRFWPKVGAPGATGCREWTFGVLHDGYGMFGRSGGHPVKAHRMAWELTYGPVPMGLHVLHHCDNPPCCDINEIPKAERVPDHPLGIWTNRDGRAGHLWLGTNADNMADMVAKGRQAIIRGAASVRAKFTDDDVREIRHRAAAGETYRVLAAVYEVHWQTIGRIVRHERYTP